MTDRARLSKLQTFKAEDQGASFLGSEHFPRDLIEASIKYDPKALAFGTGQVSTDVSKAKKDWLRKLFDAKIRGKQFLVCSGADDKLVPYRMCQPYMDFFQNATDTWYHDGGVSLQNKIYPGVGHLFSAEMVEDALEFVLCVVAGERASVTDKKAKI
jgi:hypothetical protein